MTSARRRAVSRAVGVAVANAILPGCTLIPAYDHVGPDAPESAPPRGVPRVAWIFSSGGPRGFTHVGFLKAAAELGIEPDLIVGASVGAVVGAFAAARMPAREIETLAMEIDVLSIVRLAFNSDERFSGAGLADFVREQILKTVGDTRIERLPIAFASVASRRGAPLDEVTVFNKGDVGLAVQASAAIEGRFTPVKIRGELYFDPDAATPMPVRTARALGAKRLIAIDASAHEDRAPPGAERYRESDRTKRRNTKVDAELADLVLHPDFGYWVNLSAAFRRRAIDAGYRETMAAAEQLRNLHALTSVRHSAHRDLRATGRQQ